MTTDVELQCAFGSEETCILTSVQRLGQNVEQLPREALGSNQLVELANHLCVVGLRGGINGNHTRSVAYAQYELTRNLPVNVSCQRGQVLDAGNVLLIVEDSLVEVTDAPAQRDVVVE